MTRAVLDEQANRAMLHSRVLRACCVVALTVLAPAEVRAADRYEVIIERDVQAKMRDGITLRSDVCRPQTDGKFPVLLTRTPYDKKWDADICMKWAARGSVVVAQDVRGRYASEGEWYPFKNESQDGYDTVEWAAGLPYSNGKVGMFGGSYVGAAQYLAAIAQPPHLAGICANDTASNYHDGWTHQGGAFKHGVRESGTTGLADNTISRRSKLGDDAVRWTQTLPLLSYPVFETPSA